MRWIVGSWAWLGSSLGEMGGDRERALGALSGLRNTEVYSDTQVQSVLYSHREILD